MLAACRPRLSAAANFEKVAASVCCHRIQTAASSRYPRGELPFGAPNESRVAPATAPKPNNAAPPAPESAPSMQPEIRLQPLITSRKSPPQFSLSRHRPAAADSLGAPPPNPFAILRAHGAAPR